MAVQSFAHTVTQADTAETLGSGDLPVLATPRLVNWLERATFEMARTVVEPGLSTVGTLVRIEHVKASPVGAVVTCRCSMPISDGRRLIFHVTAVDDEGAEVAVGELHRRVIDPVRLKAKFATPLVPPDPPAARGSSA